MTEICKDRNVSYILKRGTDALLSAVRKTTYVFETVGLIGNKLRQILPPSLKSINNIEKFKKEIRSWRSDSCDCRIYKIFIVNLGFL